MIDAVLLRFVAVGLLNTALGYAFILVAQHGLGMAPVAANAVGYLCGFGVSFVLHRRVTFRARGRAAQQFAGYAAAVAGCWLINLGVLQISLSTLHLAPVVAQALAIGSYTVSFFLVTRYVVFHHASDPR